MATQASTTKTGPWKVVRRLVWGASSVTVVGAGGAVFFTSRGVWGALEETLHDRSQTQWYSFFNGCLSDTSSHALRVVQNFCKQKMMELQGDEAAEPIADLGSLDEKLKSRARSLLLTDDTTEASLTWAEIESRALSKDRDRTQDCDAPPSHSTSESSGDQWAGEILDLRSQIDQLLAVDANNAQVIADLVEQLAQKSAEVDKLSQQNESLQHASQGQIAEQTQEADRQLAEKTKEANRLLTIDAQQATEIAELQNQLSQMEAQAADHASILRTSRDEANNRKAAVEQKSAELNELQKSNDTTLKTVTLLQGQAEENAAKAKKLAQERDKALADGAQKAKESAKEIGELQQWKREQVLAMREQARAIETLTASDARKGTELEQLHVWKQEQILSADNMRKNAEQMKIQLERTKAEAEKLKAAHAAQGKELSQLRQWETEKTKECSALQESVAKKSKDLDELIRWKSAQLQEAEKLHAQIKQGLAKVEELKSSDALKAKELSALQQWKQENSEDMANLNKKIQEQAAESQTLTANLNKKIQEQADESQTLTANLNKKIQEHVSEAQALTKARDDLQASDVLKSQELTGLRQWNEAKVKEAVDLQGQVKARTEQVETLQASDAQKSTLISKLEKGSKDQATQIASLSQAVKQKTSQADSLAKLRDDLQASIAQLSEELAALRDWKNGRLRDIDEARAKFLEKVAAIRDSEGRLA